MLRMAVIGVGNMGSRYAGLLHGGKIAGAELVALTRVKDKYRESLKKVLESGIPVYETADQLFDDVESGKLQLDCVVIATPHYSHESLAVRAFRKGINVLCDKPAGVYSRQARNMEEAAISSGKVFSMVFNQRTYPIYGKLRAIVRSGEYGALKRVSWTITDWYRPDSYYKSSAWRATWEKEGGGVLLNQAPHNLDMLCWICGLPARVQAFCHEGRFHDIEVEDDVTAYLEWDNGATGTFVTSTGDAPGINRLEIALEEALIICENDELRIGSIREELGMKEADYRKSSQESFRKIRGTWSESSFEKEPDQYIKILQAFADECNGRGKSIAAGREGRLSLLLSNAMYLSSWEGKMIEIPAPGSDSELKFEKCFEEWLQRKTTKAVVS